MEEVIKSQNSMVATGFYASKGETGVVGSKFETLLALRPVHAGWRAMTTQAGNIVAYRDARGGDRRPDFDNYRVCGRICWKIPPQEIICKYASLDNSMYPSPQI